MLYLRWHDAYADDSNCLILGLNTIVKHIVIWILALSWQSCQAANPAIENLKLSAEQRSQFSHADHSSAVPVSVEGISNYKSLLIEHYYPVAEKAKLEHVLTTLTFTKPLTTEQIVKLTSSYHLQPGYLFYFSEQMNAEEFLSVDSIDMMSFQSEMNKTSLKQFILTNLNETAKDNQRVVGFVAMVCLLDAKELKKIRQDPLVYLADISSDDYFIENPSDREFMPHFAWEVYKLKLGAY